MESPAPCAEPVLVTAEELLRLSSDQWRYELVDGRLVRLSPTGSMHARIVMALLRGVDRFVQDHRLGEVFPPETGFRVSPAGEPDTVLAPDLAFVRRGRERVGESEGYPRLAPDLVVEVASPSQGRTELAAKARRWLDAGVQLVWIVLPESRLVEVWSEGELNRVLATDEELLGESVLPGFTLPIESLFS